MGVLVAATLFLLVLALSASPVFATTQPPSKASAPTPDGVSLTVSISPDYTLFNPSVGEMVNASINISPLVLASNVNVTLFLSFKPQLITLNAITSNGTEPLSLTPFPGTFGSSIAYYFTLQTSVVGLTGSIMGQDHGESVLFRQVSNVPYVYIQGIGVGAYTYKILLPSGSVVSGAYTYGSTSSSLPVYPGVPDAGGVSYELVPSTYTIVVQSVWYVPVSVTLTVESLLVIVLILLGFIRPNRGIVGSLVRSINGLVTWASIGVLKSYVRVTTFLHLRNQTGKRPNLFGTGRKLHATLLILFVLSGTLMVSVGALGGPDPTLKAYVIASPPVANQIQDQLRNVTGSNVQVITPSDDVNDFQVMSSVGTFNLMVLSSYPSTAASEVGKFVIPSAENVPLIVIDNSANRTILADQLRVIDPSSVFLNVANAGNLTSSEAGTLASYIHGVKPANLFGLSLGQRGFEGLVAFEAFLSLALVFLGFGSVAAFASRSRADEDGDTLTKVATMIALGVFAFVFSEVVYVVTSAELTLPLSLHAVVSGATNITGIAVLGQLIHIPFGGGTTPRLAAGVFGVLFGALGTGKAGPFSIKSFVFMGSVTMILLLNPFIVGQYVFEGILLFVGNITFGGAYTSSITLKLLLYGVGTALGGAASPFYTLSAGKILYFAGLVPLAFLWKMGRNTASFTLLLCAFIVGDGGVRVGEMTPEKTAITMMPGLLVGVGLVLILLLVSALEKYVTTYHARSRSQ